MELTTNPTATTITEYIGTEIRLVRFADLLILMDGVKTVSVFPDTEAEQAERSTKRHYLRTKLGVI